MADLDQLLGVHSASLQLQRSRMEVLASNIANADTPGFKAKDVDFKQVMAAIGAAQSGDASSLAQTQPGHLNAGGSTGTMDLDAAIQNASVYRVAHQPSADGNTVDVQIEQAQFADAAMRYQASLNIMNHRLKSLMTAITGQ